MLLVKNFAYATQEEFKLFVLAYLLGLNDNMNIMCNENSLKWFSLFLLKFLCWLNNTGLNMDFNFHYSGSIDFYF